VALHALVVQAFAFAQPASAGAMINLESCGLYWTGTSKAEVLQIVSKWGCKLESLAGMEDAYTVYGQNRSPVGMLAFDNNGRLGRASRILPLNAKDGSSLFQLLSQTLTNLNCRASSVNLRSSSVNPSTMNRTLTFACGDRYIEVVSTVREDKNGERFDTPSISEVVISNIRHTTP
jgi:hypothetical protein